ncbi:response regulator transcription factor [uncultured Paracoccus sp.]|uniref:response regulator n=1 Tax=uncultured Paracoccus sp. TaxID=189685 RepID=UPI0025E15E5E|nr:response regulator transcription factor [uncultured Paracoccus sp.]
MTDAYSPLILIVDDARDIRDPLAAFLSRQGFRTRTAANAAEARPLLDAGGANLAIIDIMMPGESGLSLCAHVTQTSRIPVILLSACAEETDRIRGLDHGADDYVTKPFSPRELIARIRAILRRVPAERPSVPSERRRFGRLVHDPGRSLLTDDQGRAIELTTGENRLLGTLLDHAGQTVSRARLLELMRGRSPRAYDRAVDNTVSRLRRKIGDEGRPAQVIVTEWGGGYRLVGAVETLA